MTVIKNQKSLFQFVNLFTYHINSCTIFIYNTYTTQYNILPWDIHKI